MEIRECKPEDVVSLLHLCTDDKDITMFDNWAQYQRWMLDAVYNKNWQVLIADDGFGVIGFLVWNLYQVAYKYEAYVNYIYISEDFRGQGIGDALVLEFMRNSYNSSAQRWKWSTKVLPEYWNKRVSLLPPHDKYTTYYVKRDDELREWYNENIRKNSN